MLDQVRQQLDDLLDVLIPARHFNGKGGVLQRDASDVCRSSFDPVRELFGKANVAVSHGLFQVFNLDGSIGEKTSTICIASCSSPISRFVSACRSKTASPRGDGFEIEPTVESRWCRIGSQ